MAGRRALTSTTDPWSLALSRYIEDLNEEEKSVFANASLENLFYSTSVAQREHQETSKSRALSARLEPFVTAIDQYSVALDIYSNSSPLVMSPIWGSIRVLLHVESTFLFLWRLPRCWINGFTHITDIRLPRDSKSISRNSLTC